MQNKRKKLDTVRSRFAFIITITVLGCMLLIQTTSFITMNNVVTKHGRAMMEVTNEAMGRKLQDEYYTLLQNSYIMGGSGVVGNAFGKYLGATTYMDQFEAFSEMEKLLTTVIFSSGSECCVYYDSKTGRNYLEGYQNMKENFYASDVLQPISRTERTTFHAVHPSQNKIGNGPVVSLIREVPYINHESVAIYSEQRANLPAELEVYCRNDGRDYTFLQMDQSGTVCYSTDEAFPIGTQLPELCGQTEGFGRWNGYVWASDDINFGTTCVLLTPVADFYSEFDTQLRMLAITLLAAAVLITVSVLLLRNLIGKKNDILQHEIERVGEGNLEKVSRFTGLRDYDVLLERFDWMIDQINGLLQSVKDSERRRGEVEREILYYQINPHFLLNTLNSAYWLAKLNGGGIDQYIAQLIGILRYSLGKDTEPPTLRKEAEILSLYLKLQQQRHDFTCSMDVEEGEYLNLTTPRLFIQPIVENSIEHGMDVGDHIGISIQREGDRAVVIIEDNGVGMSEETQQAISNNMEKTGSRSGIGLRYVRTVLSTMFGDAATMDIRSELDKGTRVEITLPLDSLQLSADTAQKGDTADDQRIDRG